MRACDIFVLLLGATVTDPVKQEVKTAQDAGKPLLVFLNAAAPADVTAYAQSLGVKYATYLDAADLRAKVVEAVGDELITGYRRHGVARGDLTPIGDFLDKLAQGQVKIEVGGDQIIATGPVATGGSAVTTGEGVAQAIGGNLEAGGHVIVAGQGSTVVIGEAPVVMTAVDRATALGRYLHHVISYNRYLQLQGIRSGGRLVSIELDRIYIRLRATRERVVEAEDRWLAAEAGLAPGELARRREGGFVATETVTVEVEEALAAHPRLVVLGDPGSGKTTLLRYLALMYARDLAEGSHLVAEKLRLAESGRLPILLPLRQIGAFLQAHHPADDGAEGHAMLLEFLFQALKNERIDLPPDFFDAWLTKGEAVILLDGLDEVADPSLRRRVSRLVERFTQAYPDCRYVVSSRIVGYTGPARLGEGYVTTTVRDFSMADVAEFLTNWHRLVAIGQMAPGEPAEAYAAEQTRQLLAAIQDNERIRELAINPLMLTVIAMVHRERVKLPDRRAELYAEAVDVLLGKWEEVKQVQEVPILPGRPFDAGDRRLMLQGLALHMHEQQQKEIAAEQLTPYLEAAFGEIIGDHAEAGRAVRRFLDVIQERTGLLVARGEGVYAFSHLTFQEYLAALAIADRQDFVAYTLARVPDPWWREVILLEAGHLSMGGRERPTRLIRAIADLREEPEPYHNLVLAAECLRDVGAGRVQGDLEQSIGRKLRLELETRPPKGPLASVQTLLTRGMTARALTERRIAAVGALARIGGVRFWSLPYGEPEWVTIPAGEFWMGSDGQGYNEKPLHRVNLDAFQIARVPITNAQYQLFVQKTGHSAPHGWEEGRPPKGLESHPVVNVTWHDAIAYCHWLGQAVGKHVALPSEAQWEKAARGSQDKRDYPWGDTFDPARCNTAELGLGGTTPVGIFPGGASPYGVLDMSGNVWEWTRSLWGKGWEKPSFKYPYNPKDDREDLEAPANIPRVLRGGSFGNVRGFARCAVRYGYAPVYRDVYRGFRVVVSPIRL